MSKPDPFKAVLGGRTPIRMFKDRLRAEGTYANYVERVKYFKEQGKHERRAELLAASEFGFDAVQEIGRYHQEVGQEKFDEEKKKQDAINFEAAVLALSDIPDRARENEWIRAHPAMARKHMSDDDAPVKLTVADVKGAPNRQAVWSLQNWVNRPEKFFEIMASEDKKRKDETEQESRFYGVESMLTEYRKILEMIAQ